MKCEKCGSEVQTMEYTTLLGWFGPKDKDPNIVRRWYVCGGCGDKKEYQKTAGDWFLEDKKAS